MKRLIKWNLKDEDFKRAIESLSFNKNNSYDYICSVEIGELCVDITLVEYDDDIIELDFLVFAGGIDSYSYVNDDLNRPYDYAYGGTFDRNEILKIQSIDEFKEYILSIINHHIDNCGYNKDGITLVNKANSDKFFDWE